MSTLYYKGKSYTPSEVEANPSGDPTDTLETIGINGTIFDIAGSGGSGSGVYIEETLWEGSQSTSAWASPIELAIDIEPYDFIVVNIYNSMHVLSSRQIPTGTITGDISIGVGGYLNDDGGNKAAWLNKDTNILRIFTSTGISIEVRKVVGIKVSGNYFTPQIYSTEEREVGVWIDGKPLYQKSFTGTLASTLTTFSTSNLDMDELIKWEVIVNGSYDNNPLKAYQSFNADSDKVNTSFYNGDMRINTSSFWVGSGYLATIFYTKSTDTPGSGDWTPSGVPAHHYSTDEQVVGTWIDGSTVYERVYEFNTPVQISMESWTDVNDYIPNIGFGKIIEAKGIDANGTLQGSLLCGKNASNHIQLQSPRNGSASIAVSYITIQYTKTT